MLAVAELFVPVFRSEIYNRELAPRNTLTDLHVISLNEESMAHAIEARSLID